LTVTAEAPNKDGFKVMSSQDHQRVGSVTNPRVKAIMDLVVDAMREIVVKERITEDELHAAAHFMDRIGSAGGGGFAELFDIMLAMTSLETMGRKMGGTMPSLEGPFYKPNAPVRADGWLLDVPPGPDAELLTIRGRVTLHETGEPVSFAEVDVWQADEHGIYDIVGYNLRGKVITDADGRYHIETVVPYRYKIRDDGPNGELLDLLGQHSWRPAHVHFKVWVDGALGLTTQFYFADSDYLDSDVANAVRDELVVSLSDGPVRDGVLTHSLELNLSIAGAAIERSRLLTG
jgi:protocatechuate 3,4-dioxygenase beta subunit